MQSFDLVEGSDISTTPAEPEIITAFHDLYFILTQTDLSEREFCTFWSKAAGFAYHQGNLIALQMLLHLLNAAAVKNTPSGQLLWHEYSGKMMLLEGACDRATYHFQLQTTLAQAQANYNEMIQANLNLARACLWEYRLDAATVYLQEAEGWTVDYPDPAITVKLLNRRAELAAYQHLTDLSIEEASQALALARQHQLPLEEAFALNWLGVNYMYRREWVQAEQALLQALELRQAARDVLGRAETLATLSRFYLKQGKLLLADASLDSSLAIVEQMKYLPGVARAVYLKALLLYHTNQSAKALAWAMRAVEARLQLSEPTKLAEAFSLLGQIYADLGQPTPALLCHTAIPELYTPGNTNPQWIKLLIATGDYLLQLRSSASDGAPDQYWQQALTCYRAANEIVEQHKELYYLAPLMGRMARSLLKIQGMDGLTEAIRCYRIQLSLLGDITSPFFDTVIGIAQRAEALNGIQICASLLRRYQA
jgi:tetratricopeptide (TPR) repeat protein